MITIIDMVSGKVIHNDNGQSEPVERVVAYELPAYPMLQEITFQAEQRAATIPADLATIAVDDFLRNR